jgi:hypothetical protein
MASACWLILMTHGQTSFTDPYGNIFTGYNGAIISTVAQKFGTASIRLPGNGGRFDVPSNPLNQFTIEFFFRMDDKTTPLPGIMAGDL